MYKRIIAVAAALGMIYGSALLPAADTGGEPVRQVTGKLNKTEKTELRNSKTEISTTESTYVSTKEKVYGPIRPVPVKEEDDDRDSESDMGAASGGEEAGSDGVSIGEAEVATDIDNGADGSAGDCFDAGDYEPEPVEDDGEAGYDFEETGEDCGEDVIEPTADTTDPTAEPTTEPTVEDYSEVASEPSMEYLGDFTVTAYCNCESCTGIWSGGPCADGSYPVEGYTCAMGDIPFGTVLYIDGVGERVVCDRGTPYGWIDLYFADHGCACDWGMQTRSVWIAR